MKRIKILLFKFLTKRYFQFFFPSLDLEIAWDSPPIYDKEILDDLMSQSFIVYKNVSIVQESIELKG